MEINENLTAETKEITNSKQKYSFIYVILSLSFVVLMLLSNIAASNILHISSFLSLSAAEIIFPLSYIINDIIVEVYGYDKSKRIIWLGLVFALCSNIILYLTTLLPTGYHEYSAVFGKFNGGLIGISAASFVAYLSGAFLNSFIMSQLKERHKSKKFFLRAMVSTFAGEFIDSLLFITACCIFAPKFYAWNRIIPFVITITTIKVIVELAVFPLTNLLVKKIKKHEPGVGIESKINYNPFSFKTYN